MRDERDTSACLRRHKAIALASVSGRERRFRVYMEAPGFHSVPRKRERETHPRV
jgi:hypothetical protein